MAMLDFGRARATGDLRLRGSAGASHSLLNWANPVARAARREPRGSLLDWAKSSLAQLGGSLAIPERKRFGRVVHACYTDVTIPPPFPAYDKAAETGSGASKAGGDAMNIRWICTFVLAICLQPQTVQAQIRHGPRWSSQVIVPQARVYAPGHSQALEITAVRAGVVIREQIATTMMEIQRSQPGRDASGGRAARSCACRGGGAELRIFKGLTRSRRHGCFRGTRLARPTIGSSPRRATPLFSSLPGSTWSGRAFSRSSREGRQAVRLTYEHHADVKRRPS